MSAGTAAPPICHHVDMRRPVGGPRKAVHYTSVLTHCGGSVPEPREHLLSNTYLRKSLNQACGGSVIHHQQGLRLRLTRRLCGQAVRIL